MSPGEASIVMACAKVGQFMRHILTAVPLTIRGADNAYPLVSLVAPLVTEARWRGFVGEWLSGPQCRTGIAVVQNAANILLAAYAWQVLADLDSVRSLRVPQVFIAGLPGRSLGDFVLSAIDAEAQRRQCDTVILEQTSTDFPVATRIPRECLDSAGFVSRGEIVIRAPARTNI